MNAIKKWFADHSISSHAISAALIAAFGVYTSDPNVRDFVNSLLATHPKILAAIGTAAGLYLKYSGAHSAQGKTAEVANLTPAEIATVPTATKQEACDTVSQPVAVK